MGCTQTSPSIMPYNHVPIERLYNNASYPKLETPPLVTITAPPTPSYVKSVLKKPHSYSKERPELIPMSRAKRPLIVRSVNFDEQVLVKPRTPSPDKVWYEKASSTTPMRKHPPNDDDDYDYDYEESESNSSDEEHIGNGKTDVESQKPHDQAKHSWYKTNKMEPQSNTALEYKSSPLSGQQSSPNVNKHAKKNLTPSSANTIKVRRKLPILDAPQTTFAPSYQSSTILPYQHPIQSATVPIHQIPTQTPNISTHQSIIPSHQSSVQYSTASSIQNSIISLQQPTVNHSTISFVQSPISSSTQTLKNSSLVKHTLPSIYGELSSPIVFYALKNRPLENIIPKKNI
ncbi:unnamed protein product [Adineta steineri]|uniref:Uncharacterized protein n=1 Tax=Adineta steineri TaxID=433720 RepID=A0A818GNC2_9BILA|nr:unnamed protein product [Adineta steineri]